MRDVRAVADGPLNVGTANELKGLKPMRALPVAGAGAAPGRFHQVTLLRADRGLRDAIAAHEVAFAERVVIARRHDLDPGPWSPQMLVVKDEHPFAALLLRGVVTHEIMLAGRCSASLFGPGDCFRPWHAIDTALPCTARWETSGAVIAVLDERFLTAARRWPGLAAVILERLAQQLDVSALRTAIVGLPRVEQRVLAAFWQLAERWGIVRPHGIVVRLALTHALIGHLVGAQRPTVSLALQALAEDGLLRRTEPTVWTLSHGSRDALACDLGGALGPSRDACTSEAPPSADAALAGAGRRH